MSQQMTNEQYVTFMFELGSVIDMRAPAQRDNVLNRPALNHVVKRINDSTKPTEPNKP